MYSDQPSKMAVIEREQTPITPTKVNLDGRISKGFINQDGKKGTKKSIVPSSTIFIPWQKHHGTQKQIWTNDATKNSH